MFKLLDDLEEETSIQTINHFKECDAMVYPNLRLTETDSSDGEADFGPLPFRLINDMLYPSAYEADPGDEALRTIDRLSTTLDSFRQQLDELEDDGPRPAA